MKGLVKWTRVTRIKDKGQFWILKRGKFEKCLLSGVDFLLKLCEFCRVESASSADVGGHGKTRNLSDSYGFSVIINEFYFTT